MSSLRERIRKGVEGDVKTLTIKTKDLKLSDEKNRKIADRPKTPHIPAVKKRRGRKKTLPGQSENNSLHLKDETRQTLPQKENIHDKEIPPLRPPTEFYCPQCNKKYKTRRGIIKHIKKCII
jgi:hypothetical protein